jgi:hypothetical protein
MTLPPKEQIVEAMARAHESERLRIAYQKNGISTEAARKSAMEAALSALVRMLPEVDENLSKRKMGQASHAIDTFTGQRASHDDFATAQYTACPEVQLYKQLKEMGNDHT